MDGFCTSLCEVDEADVEDFKFFATVVRRIFSCLRSHSKDTPARKVDFIDNRIIGTSTVKKSFLDFLLKEGSLYKDEQDWLYKLDTAKMSKYNINWNSVREGDINPLVSIYDIYIKTVK